MSLGALAVAFYDRGGNHRDEAGRALDVRPLQLAASECDDLVAFLEALTSPVRVDCPEIP